MSDGVGSGDASRRNLLIGRVAERAVIDELLRDAASGTSGSLVISGSPGIGKSSLLRYVVEEAAGFRVLRVIGVESEMAFGYAGVHQLVLPVVDAADALPDPQRLALQAVFGTVQHEPPDRYLVGLAVLSLLADAARAQPILVVVDDAQWLDDESLTVLEFVARRLHAEAVALVAVVRTTPGTRGGFEGVRRLDLKGLTPPEAVELLTTAAGAPIDAAVAERIVAATEGNPLALTELPTTLTRDQLGGAAPLPDPLPIAARLSTVFEPRLRALDDDARALLLLAAAEREGDLGLLRRAATGIVRTRWEVALAAAEATGLVTFVPKVEFRHSLVRSAVYYAAAPVQRRAAHAALADALVAVGDPDRRAWHLGAAASGPDEGVVGELEEAAARVRRRGGLSVAAAYLWRAAELSPDADRAGERLLEGARAELTAGRSERAHEILDRSVATGLQLQHRGDAAWTEALIHLVAGRVREAGQVLVRALPDIAVDSAELAVGICVAADAVALAGAHLLDDATRVAIADGTRRICTLAALPHPLSQFVRGVAGRLTGEDGDAVPLLRGALTAATGDRARFEQTAGHHIHVVYLDTVLAAVDTLDDRSWDDLTAAWVELARQAGALAALPPALGLRSWLEVLQGRVGSAASHLAEAEDLASLTGVRAVLGSPPAAAVLHAAWRGEDEAARTGARQMMQDGHERGQGIAVTQGYAALTVLEIGCGRYDAALRAARRGVEHDAAGLGTIALADLVECAVRCGESELANRAAERLTGRVSVTGTPWARGLLARSRALVATGDGADELYRSALEELSRSTLATERARTSLLYGEWLRRGRRRREAREPLQDALEVFETIGAERFASRAAAELAATGQQVRKRSAPADTLTPQEAQIARLAAAGERNHEIAAQLYITTSTVEYHLRKVFVKLAVTSRTQLAQVDLPS